MLARDPLAAQVVWMLAGRSLAAAALIGRLDAPAAKVEAVLDRLAAHGFVARRPGRGARWGIRWREFGPWIAMMAAGPETRDAAGAVGGPMLEVEVGEFGGWHPVVKWSPRVARMKVPGLIAEVGRHPGFHDLVERHLILLRNESERAAGSVRRESLSGIASALESVLLQAGHRISGGRTGGGKALARMLRQWRSWRIASHTVSEDAWIESLTDAGILLTGSGPRRTG